MSGWGVNRTGGKILPGPPQKVQHVPVDDDTCRQVMGTNIKDGNDKILSLFPLSLS